MNDNMPGSGDAASTASDMRDTVRHKAADLASEAKDQARQQYDRQISTATGELDSLASALRRAGGELGEQHGMSSRVVTTVADRIESFSRSLDGKDLDRVVRDVETFARRNPAAFLGGAVAVGFLAARFLKSDRPDTYGNSRDYDTGDSQYGINRGASSGTGYASGLEPSGYGIEKGSDFGVGSTGMPGSGTTGTTPRSGSPGTTSGTATPGMTPGGGTTGTPGVIGTASETGDRGKGRR
ncbi:MAG TPA: hypothetical protein VF701_18275 [Thermoanaerobaculia bacterium]